MAKIQEILPSGSEVYGMGYAQYGTVEEYVVIAKRSGDPKATVHILTVTTSWPMPITQYASNTVEASDWQFTQFGQYIYGVNTTDGLWRRKIGTTTGLEVWQRVNTRFKFDGSSGVVPDTLVSRNWNDTGFDSANAFAPLTIGIASFNSIIQPDGSWTVDFSVNPGLAGNIQGYVWWSATVADTSGGQVDFRSARYPSFVLEQISATFGNLASWFISPARPLYLWVWDGTGSGTLPSAANATNSASWIANGWKLVPVTHRSTNTADVIVTADMDAIAATCNLSNIKKIALGTCVDYRRDSSGSGNLYVMRLGPLLRGGVFLNKPTTASLMVADPSVSYASTIKTVEYIVQYYNSVTSAESTGIKLSLSAQQGWGDPVVPGGIPIGARASVEYFLGTGALAPASFDKIRIWRKRHSDAAKWHLLLETPNANGKFVDARVEALTDAVAWGTITTRANDNEFEGTTQTLAPRALAVWQGHMVLGVGEEIYMSYGGAPDLYIPPARDLPQLLDIDDPTIGRTLYMSYDQSDKVLGIVADDFLYLIGTQGVYAMIGDSAIEATPPRLLPGSRGAFGTRAFCKAFGGVLVANEEGIDLHVGSRALSSGSDSIYAFERLTKDIERTYKRFIADPDNLGSMVLREWQGEIYAIIDNRFLKRTRAGTWQEGEWAQGALEGTEYAGAGGPGGSAGVPFGDDPGTGAAFPAGPYTSPGTIVIGAPVTTVHGTPVWRSGIVLSQYEPSGGIGKVPTVYEMLPEGEIISISFSRSGRPSHSIVEAIGVSGKGFRGVSFNGTFVQFSYTSNGGIYLNDAGYPIEWMQQGKDFEFPYPYRVSMKDLFVNSYERKAGSQPLRIVATSTDGLKGSSQQYYDVPSGLNWPDQKIIAPGSRWNFIVAGRSASQVAERIELSFEPQKTKGT
jgi:hypothetical protein